MKSPPHPLLACLLLATTVRDLINAENVKVTTSVNENSQTNADTDLKWTPTLGTTPATTGKDANLTTELGNDTSNLPIDSIQATTQVIFGSSTTGLAQTSDDQDKHAGGKTAAVIIGLFLFIALNVTIAVLWGWVQDRRAKKMAKKKEEARLQQEAYDDTLVGLPNRQLKGSENPAFKGDEYDEIGGSTPKAAHNIYHVIASLPVPTLETQSMSSGERTPVYQILEQDAIRGPARDLMKMQTSGLHDLSGEAYASLRSDASGPHVYQSLERDKSNTPALVKDAENKLQHISTNMGDEQEHELRDSYSELTQEDICNLAANKTAPNPKLTKFKIVPQISVVDTDTDDYDSVPIETCVKDIEIHGQPNAPKVGEGDVYLELVPDDQVGANKDCYDYIDINKKRGFSWPLPRDADIYTEVVVDDGSGRKWKHGVHDEDTHLKPRSSKDEDSDNDSEAHDYSYAKCGQRVSSV